MPSTATIEGGAVSRLIKLTKDSDPCWEWQGALTAQGYPRKTWFGRAVQPRRWVYAMLIGPVPSKRVLAMKCNNKLCVNPFHARVTTMISAQGEGDATKIMDSDAEDMRKRLAHPRAHQRMFRAEMVTDMAEEYGICREYVMDILANKRRVDNRLPKTIAAVIRYYKENPPCASTS